MANEEMFGTCDDPVFFYFAYSHLPEHLQVISKKFFELAYEMTQAIKDGPERSVMLRKLLEAKDAAVRAKMNPGG